MQDKDSKEYKEKEQAYDAAVKNIGEDALKPTA